jgi:hypothetical protein
MGGWLKDTLVMFGRVPFAFYVAHFILIHLLAIGGYDQQQGTNYDTQRDQGSA